jgi:hypothetical protein
MGCVGWGRMGGMGWGRMGCEPWPPTRKKAKIATEISSRHVMVTPPTQHAIEMPAPAAECAAQAEAQMRDVSRGASAEVRQQIRDVSRGASAEVRQQVRCQQVDTLPHMASASYGKCLIWQVPHMAGDRSHVTDRRAPRSQVNSTQVTSRTAGLVGRRLVRCAAKEADDTEGTQRLLNRRHRAGLLSRRKGLGRGDLVRGGVNGRVRGRVWMVRWTIGCEW